MATYALIENNNIVSLHDVLPPNWNNVSNFSALKDDEQALNNFGWYTIQKTESDFTTDQPQGLTEYRFCDGIAQQIYYPPQPEQQIQPSVAEEVAHQQLMTSLWSDIRSVRDRKMQEFEWRYTRHEREQRLGLHSTDQLHLLDTYMQQLADITKTFSHPSVVVWPEWND